MPSSPIDEIKSRVDILELIGSYIKLVKAGRNWRARCPFHNERTPSFMVSPERQIWHCFGCGEGGDIFGFVKQIEGVEFGDALRILARRAGVVLKRQNPETQTQRKHLYEICELAAKFFEKQLESHIGQRAFQYLIKERGLKKETIKTWRLGWAPDDWHALSDFLRQRGYREQEIFDAGLIIKSDPSPPVFDPEAQTRRASGTGYKIRDHHDRFRSRIMFPIFDIQGQVVGFAGRIFGKEDPPPVFDPEAQTRRAGGPGKYINTPQTILYDKSRLLYGLNFAKMDIRQSNACIFVEGNLDVILSHQAGVKNTVASSGTALTHGHLQIIKRYDENLYFAFDMDSAGDNATRRSIELALENDFNIKVVQIGEKDPADLIKQDPLAWSCAIKEAVPIIDYYFASTFKKFNSPAGGIRPEDKKQIAKILLPIIKKIANEIERAHWIGELSKHLHTDEKLLFEELKKIKISETDAFNNSSSTPRAPAKVKSHLNDIEERLLSLYLNYPQHLSRLKESPSNLFFNQELVVILEELIKIASKTEASEKCLVLIKKNLPENLHNRVDHLSFCVEQYGIDENMADAEIQECQKALKICKLKDQMKDLRFRINDAQSGDDKKKLDSVLKKFNELSSELINLN